MKLFAILASLFVTFSANAKIWRVNNNVGIAADFTTLQLAHNGAAAGDTIYVEGSNNSYGALTATKQLTIIGPGYFLDLVPNTQAVTLSAKVGNINLNQGSTGTVLQGLDFEGNTLNVYVNDVVIRKNRFGNNSNNDQFYYFGLIYLNNLNNNGTLNGVSNIVISQNCGLKVSALKPSNNILITNNIFGYDANYGDNTTNTVIDGGVNTVMLIQNNIIRRGKVNVYGSTVTNNIMIAGFFSANNNLYSNNIGNSTQFGLADGNKSNVSMADVFAYTGAPDEGFKLKAGSPAIGAGYGSTQAQPVDCGIFSGSTPYVVAGQVNMPAIYYFSNQPIGSNTDPIKVTIKVKAAGN